METLLFIFWFGVTLLVSHGLCRAWDHVMTLVKGFINRLKEVTHGPA